MEALRRIAIKVSVVMSLVVCSFSLAATSSVCEDFDSGFSGAVGNHADWYPDGGGPTVTSGTGSDGSGWSGSGHICASLDER